MAIRNSAKAIVLKDDKILLNRCRSRLGVYFALPGGGQLPGETLTEAIVRELLEETGLTVKPNRLAGIYEHITTGRDAGMDHKLYFVFMCDLCDELEKKPTERDMYQLGSEWVPVEDAVKGRLFPHTIRDNLTRMMQSEGTLYLGSERKR
jgi:ADP-ribose pyrophosphatase YjhB (NUDIX family)